MLRRQGHYPKIRIMPGTMDCATIATNQVTSVLIAQIMKMRVIDVTVTLIFKIDKI